MVPPRLLLAAAGVVLISVAVPVGAQSRREQDLIRPEVVDLDIRGVDAVEEKELRESIATDESKCKSLLYKILACWWTKHEFVFERHYLNRDELARDLFRIQVFYFKRGYRMVEVDSIVDGSARSVRVVLEVKEGEPTQVARLTVRRPEGILEDERVGRLMQLRAGQPLNLLDLDSSRVRLENALWDMGYSDAVVNTDTIDVSADRRSATVLVSIDPRWVATIQEIRIAGNRKIGPRTILNSLTFSPGDIYRRQDLIRSQRQLYDSELFRRAQIIVPPQGDTTKIVEVTVDEAPLRSARVGGGFNTADFVQVEGRFTNRNWSGGARRIDLNLTVGNLFASGLNDALFFRDVFENVEGDRSEFTQPTWRAGADFRQPWFRSHRNTLGLGAFASRRSVPGIFVDRSLGGTATFTRDIVARAPATLGYRFELNRVAAGDIYFCVNYGVCDVPTVTALQREQRLSPIQLTASVDRTNDALNPTAGYVARAELEHASTFTISDYRYNRAAADGAVYRRIGNGMVLATHLRLGWVQALESTGEATGAGGDGAIVLHPRKRFYAGGSQSVRGFREGQLGPRVLTIPPGPLIERGCTLAFPATAVCPPGAVNGDTDPGDADNRIPDTDFTPRPLGGRTLAEGSVELRFPIWGDFAGAAFLDGAIVGSGTLVDLAKGTAALTPGIGVRYHSPVGPIRVDLGFNPFISEDLPVLTQVVEPGGTRSELVLVQTGSTDALRTYAPAKNEGGISGFLKQLTLHLSIGHAF